MKLLLVIASDETYSFIASYVRPLGFELIRYRHPLKAMDNIDEVDPDGVIISGEDFPRHWKTLVQFIRSERPKDRTAIVILKGPNFPFEEAAKASYIGVSGIVSDKLSNPEELDRLQGILSRYLPIEDGRRSKRIRPKPWDRFGFVACNPVDHTFITGSIETISSTGLSFLPDNAPSIQQLGLDTLLTECSLRVGDKILSPVCKLVRTGKIVSFHFESFPEGEQAILNDYIQSRPLRERKYIQDHPDYDEV
ncbi:MAG TPA: PilZ domain-containing protein [Treponema sp.]|nr:PilZ domain-containing protein [Treponema sp.]